jgi:hypothetical protein
MSIFKYLPEERFALALVSEGELHMKPLSHFRRVEDQEIRGDPNDAVLNYAPSGGLQLHEPHGKRLPPGEWYFRSEPKEEIFVFCTSTELSAELANRFRSPFCVEITDPETLLARIRSRAHPSSKLDYERTVGDLVNYRENSSPPGSTWALPDKLALTKAASFAWQKEHRIAVGRRGAFDFENVTTALQKGTARISETDVQPLLLRVGTLAKVARLHRF